MMRLVLASTGVIGRSGWRCWTLVILFAALPPAVFSQTNRATLTGSIADRTGAVLAGATISAVHVDTGTNLIAVTSQTGNYTITQLPPGGYIVTVEHPGFKQHRREGFTLSAATIQRLDVTLDVGSVSDTVTITAESSLMKTDSGTLVHNITPAQIQALPLLPVGGFIRDPFALMQTVPGFTNNLFAARINGLPFSTIQYRLDGEVLGQLFNPNVTTRTQPSPDAVEEMAVQTSNFTAEYGSVSGALVNLSIKSGTNRYHGTAYDYAVNEVLNANDPAVHRKNRVRRHDYGFNIGGPVRIPWLYDGAGKTFFFFNWEQYRDRQLQATGFPSPTVPTQQYRDGNFSALPALLNNQLLRLGGPNPHDYVDPLGNKIVVGTLFDPRSGQTVPCNVAISQDCGSNGTLVNVRSPFAGNLVPANLQDRVALAIQNKYIPLPQGPSAALSPLQNYYNPFETSRTTSSPALKIDQNLGRKGRLSFTWTDNRTESPVQGLGIAEGLPEPITANVGAYESAPTYRLNFDYTIRPTMMLHLGVGWSSLEANNNTVTLDYNAEEDIGLRGATLHRNFPRMGSTIVGNPALGGMNAMGPTGQVRTPERRPSVTASIAYVRGNHTVKSGADFRQDMLPTLTYTNAAGNYDFLGPFGNQNGITWQPALQGLTGFSGNSIVGFPYANFLMGSVRGVVLSQPIAYRRSKQQWGLYVQDTWRARRNLTVDFGLRWDYGTYTAEDFGRVANLSLLEPNPSAGGRLGALIYEATCRCHFADNYPYAIGPRLAAAYTLTDNTVLRGGFGLAYGSIGTVSGTAQNSANGGTPLPGEDLFKLRDGIPAHVAPRWPVFDPGLGHTPGTVVGAVGQLVDPNAGRPDRTWQWNFTLQREIARDWVVEASYVGNRNVWQTTGAMFDFNAVGEDLLRYYGFAVGNADDATLLNQPLIALNPTQRGILQARGVGLPYAGFPTTQTVFQSIRPYPQYSGSISPAAPVGKSWYDAFQLTAAKRYSHGLQFTMNYTFAKNLQHTSAPDVFNRDIGKDYVTANQPHVLRFFWEYQVPKPYESIPLLGSKIGREIVGGWAVSAALVYQSGAFLGRPASATTNAVNRWLGRGPGSAQLKQNADGSYMSPWSVNWTDLDGNQRTDPLDIDCHCFDPEKTVVLNPDAWENIPAGVWAHQSNVIYGFRGARRPNEAMNFARNFSLGPEGKYTLQVRVEFQNVLNRKYLPNPITGGNYTQPPALSADGRYIGGYGTFGNLRAPGVFGQARAGQFIARFTF